jgi:hypothetical protein
MADDHAQVPFDFEEHRRKAVDTYVRVRSDYEEFAFAVRNILRETIRRRNLRVHSVDSRAKSLKSLETKLPDVPKKTPTCQSTATQWQT